MNCPICHNDLPDSEFGIAKARKSGRNLYCKQCCREKMVERREAARQRWGGPCICGCGELVAPGREYRQGHCFKGMEKSEEWRQNIGEGVKATSQQRRVLLAIKGGARTQGEIARQAKLPFDQLGDVLVKLILEEKKVVSRTIGEDRIYEVRAA